VTTAAFPRTSRDHRSARPGLVLLRPQLGPTVPRAAGVHARRGRSFRGSSRGVRGGL